MPFARDERHALVDTMRMIGPDAPTLCGDWTVRDLAAHIVLRERRFDASPGIMVSALSGYADRVQRGIARRDWNALLDDVRSGPPVWSPLRWVDEQANLAEMFVHHEDVRRAQKHWSVRALPDRLQDKLWAVATGIGRRSYRRSPLTVVLERPDGKRATVRSVGATSVTLRGEPAELLMYAFGRDQAQVEFEGKPEDVAVVAGLDRNV
ncbi:TIGR03085 family metal-binding protein [Rhodococcus spongiicola]|uniref:TIGR03085 family protein n=1 Tax=Rhodococcus spongiicola TaxID=2487352 RepID=A0A3S3CQX7_9NOCA|nr:TIGR03085 family metal-binding protein [Rhodococcus spongiicola]RVW03569.1 TIGR03085 family protein [Rhodococcus spongiicola]